MSILYGIKGHSWGMIIIQFMKTFILLIVLMLLAKQINNQCNFPCDTCDSSDHDHCLSCDNVADPNRDFDGGTNTCPCVSGWMESSLGAVCVQCGSKCQTCSTDPDSCDSCYPLQFRQDKNGDKNCICMDNYYDDGSFICQSCHPSCLTCVNTDTDCTSCDFSTTNRDDQSSISGSCPCKQNYFQVNTTNCSPCKKSCKTCQQSANNCTSCYVDLVTNREDQISSDHSCPCTTHYYGDIDEKNCHQCSHSCENCTSQFSCSSCGLSATTHRTISGTTCPCDAGYYDNGNDLNCVKCHYSCETCNGGLETDCQSCIDANNRQKIQNLPDVICKCKDGFYQPTVQNQVCQPCQHSCSTCTNSTQCLSCDTAKGRLSSINASNLCSCAPRKYDDGSSQQCKDCHQKCITCSSPSQSDCTVCSSTRYKLGSKCVCQDGFYQSGTHECNPCNPSCQTCINSLGCTSCNVAINFRVLNGSTGFCSCIAGFYDPNNVQLCQKCHKSCFYCSGATENDCTSCNSTARRRAGWVNPDPKGKCVCEDGYYADPSNNQQCLKCSIKCATCVDNADKCLSCPSLSFRNYGSNLCPCNSGYYENSTMVCPKCPNRCQTCSSPSICDSCPDQATTGRIAGAQCPCGDKKFDNGDKNCQDCKKTCKTCSNSNFCTSCDQTQNLVMSNGLCVCKLRYFLNGLQVCQSCDPTCLTCSAQLAANCYTCNATAHRQKNTGLGTCLCSSGYYDNGVDELCPKCSYKCLTCIGSSNNCDSCPASSNRNNDAPSCSCSIKYYDDTINTNCKSCHYSCKSCSNPNSCDDCQDSSKRVINGSGLCGCKPTYYDDGFNELCRSCPTTCPSCISPTICTSCDSLGQKRTLQNSTCICTQGYFDAGADICSQCSLKCLGCNPTGCTSCNSLNYRYLDNSKCLCLQGYFDTDPLNPNGSPICSPCSYKCASCESSSESCTSCNSGQFRQKQSNACPCLKGYYDSGVPICQKCHYSCSTCQNSSDCLICDSLKGRKQAVVGTGTCICSADFYKSYDDGKNQLCVKCDYRCLSCSILGCTSCPLTRYSSGSVCLCQNGFYDDGVSSTCTSCHSSCKTCVNGSACSSCDSATSHRIFNDTTRVCSCLPNFYQNSVPVCPQCWKTCLTCSGPNDNQCQSCNSSNFRAKDSNNKCSCITGYFELTSSTAMCSKCKDYCQSCNDILTCATCNPDHQRQQIGNDCVCKPGFFSNGTAVCAKCHYSCVTCSQYAVCDLCDTTTRQPQTGGVCICKDQFYDNGILTTCSPCLDTCATCSNGLKCTSCRVSDNRQLSNANCICKQRHFLISGNVACTPCHETCLSCTSSSTTCTSCNSTAHRILDQANKCNCMDGYYPPSASPLQECIKCDFSCSKCIDSSGCSDCNSAVTNRISVGTTCVCKDKFYSDGANPICQPCHHSCHTCQNALQCLDCDNSNTINRVLTVNSITGRCDCAVDYFDDGSNEKCLSCPYHCGSCTNSTECATCDLIDHRSLVGKVCTCDIGYYQNPPDSKCGKCDYSCLTCSSSGSCLTCNSSDGRELNGQCKCITGYYEVNAGQSQCAPCIFECLSCQTSAMRCTACPTHSGRPVTPNVDNRCPCQNGYYQTNTAICGKCHYSCLTCSSSEMCSTCDLTNHHRSIGPSGFCQCQSKYFNNGTNQVCVPCHYTCLTCANQTSSGCFTCSSSSLRTLINGTCSCNQFYVDPNSENCIKCDYSCLTCSDASSCSSCDSSKKRTYDPITSKCGCIAGYFDQVGASQQQCFKCPYMCLSCTNSTQCVDCTPGTHRSLKNKLCVCDDGYYDPGNSILQCKPCHYSCKTCSSNSSCFSCDFTKNRIQSASSPYCVCDNKFYDDGLQPTCQPCNSSCFNCVQGSVCTICAASDNRYLLPNKSCGCLDGFYEETGNSVCQPCDYTCRTCSGIATNCTSCNSTKQRTLSISSVNSCPCNQYYYTDVSPNSMCLMCHYTCQSCTEANKCDQCNSTKFRQKDVDNLKCSCKVGYVDKNIQLCSACHYTCATCTVSVGKCTTCDEANMKRGPSINPTTQKCDCITKFYDKGEPVCSSCLFFCQTCNNGSSCLTCSSSKFRIMNISTRICDCAKYYYNDTISTVQNQLCQPCQYSCNTCTLGTQCTSCSNSDLRQYDPITKLCKCMDSFYNDGTIRLCKICPYSCVTCSNGNQCLTCNQAAHFRKFDPATKQCVCKDGYYNDGQLAKCKPCKYNCQKCTNYTACTKCFDNSYRLLDSTNPSNPQCVCPDKYYDDFINPTCKACAYNCKTCKNSTGCFTCSTDSTFNRIQNGSFCNCKPGFFDNYVSEVCLGCSHQCITCSGSSNNCILCDPTKYRGAPPLCKCLSKFFDDGSPLCKPCHYSCQECEQTSVKCTSCDALKFRTLDSGSHSCKCLDKYYDDNTFETCGSCEKNCAICESQLVCNICVANSNRQIINGKCVCLIKFYEVNNSPICQPCHYSCKSCINGTACQECEPSSHRSLNLTTGLCTCLQYYYDDTLNNQLCKQCHQSCETCTNGTHCKSCNFGNYMTLNSSADFFGVVSNYCVCYYGTYQVDINHCDLCHFTCEVCSGPNREQCNFCASSNHRKLSASPMGSCICQDGLFDDGDQSCQLCDPSCVTCSGPSNKDCHSCDPEYYYIPSLATCGIKCPDYTFTHPTIMECPSCSPHCIKCDNLTYCYSCDLPYYYLNLTTVATCESDCTVTHFKDQVNHKCATCQSSIPHCVKCLNSGTCTECDLGHSLTDAQDECYVCHISCMHCDAGSDTNCTDCYYPKYLNHQNRCIVISCGSDQFVHSLNGCTKCVPKFPNAATCTNLIPLTCLSGYVLKDNMCVECQQKTGYFVNTRGLCQEVCGDGINYQGQCDDGNKNEGDGCSPYCKIEDGWSCQNSVPTSPSACKLTGSLNAKITSSRKIPGKNQFIIRVTISRPIHLTSSNFTLSLSNNALVSYTMKSFSLTEYQFDIFYKSTIQSTQISLFLGIARSRLLQEVRLLQSFGFDFKLEIQTFPPLIYYPQTIGSLFDGMIVFFNIICGATLALAVLGLVGFKRAVYYSIELFNLMVIIYVIQGMGLIGYSDWIAYSIIGMKPFVLIGGFSLGLCKCFSDIQQYSYGYADQLFQNAGVVIIMDIVLLLLLGVIYMGQKLYNRKIQIKNQIKWIDYLWIFGKYYILAFFLIFNANVLFSSSLTLYTASVSTQVAAANIAVASLILISSIIFLIGLFLWTKELLIPIVYQTPLQHPTLNFEKNERSSAVLSDKQNKSFASPRSQPRRRVIPSSESSEHPSRDEFFDNSQIGDKFYQNGKEEKIHPLPNDVEFASEMSLANFNNQHLQQQRPNTVPTPQKVSCPPPPSEYLHPKYQRMLMCDFQNIFIESNWGRYYIFLYSLLLFCTLLLTGFLQKQPLAKFIIIFFLHTVFLGYIMYIKPFKSKWNNFKAVIIQLIIMGLLGCNIGMVTIGTYQYGLQLGIMVSVCIILIINIGMYVVQIVLEYYVEICGILGIQKKKDTVAPVVQDKKIQEQIDQNAQKVEMDAFFERVLKKNRINKQYRRERRLKQREE